MRATGVEMIDLLREAGAIRDARTGPVITYSRKVFIPLTNLCRDRCGYCTFAREPGDGKAHAMSPDAVVGVSRASRPTGRRPPRARMKCWQSRAGAETPDARKRCSVWATNRSYAIPSIAI